MIRVCFAPIAWQSDYLRVELFVLYARWHQCIFCLNCNHTLWVNSLAKEITCRKSSAAWTRTCNLQITSRELGYTTRPNTPQTWELCLSNQLQLSRLPTRTEIARRAFSQVASTVWNELLLKFILRIHLATSELFFGHIIIDSPFCGAHPTQSSASIHIFSKSSLCC